MFPIRILYIINSVNIGGAETTLLNLIDGLNRSQFEIFFCIIGKSPLADEVRSRGHEVREIGPFRGKKDIHFLINLAQLVREINPDVIHSHIWFTNLYASVCGKLLGVPVVSTFHSNHSIETFFERLSLRTIYHFSKRVVMVSYYQVRHFGFSSTMPKLNVIQNGISIPSLREMRPHEKDQIKANRLGVFNADKIITCVSNLRPVKGHIFALQAIRFVLKEYRNIRLLLIGDGSLRQELIQSCEEYGISDKVEFLGFRTDVRDLLAVTDIYVHPSLSETTSLSIMEAMSMGKPVIAGNVGGTPELIDDGEDGILVTSGDAEAIANKIILLLRNKNYAAQLGTNARSKAKRKFSVDVMVNNYEKLYHEIKSN